MTRIGRPDARGAVPVLIAVLVGAAVLVLLWAFVFLLGLAVAYWVTP